MPKCTTGPCENQVGGENPTVNLTVTPPERRGDLSPWTADYCPACGYGLENGAHLTDWTVGRNSGGAFIDAMRDSQFEAAMPAP